MSIITTTHLNFRGGEARAALEFYAEAFGGEVTAATYADFGMPPNCPARNTSSSGRSSRLKGSA